MIGIIITTITMLCPKCKYEWNYNGMSYWALCPRCMYKFNTKKKTEDEKR